MKSFLFECREAAKNCHDILIKKMLRDATDALQWALSDLAKMPSVENMQTVVALWTKAHMIKEKALPLPDPIPPQSSAGELERIAA